MKTKNSRLNFIFASNLAVVVLLIVAIVAAVNYLGVKVHKRFDLTAGKVHSLSDQSVQVARGLKKDLEIKAFFSKGNSGLGRLQSLLEIYRFHSRPHQGHGHRSLPEAGTGQALRDQDRRHAGVRI